VLHDSVQHGLASLGWKLAELDVEAGGGVREQPGHLEQPIGRDDRGALGFHGLGVASSSGSPRVFHAGH
jgi:hypothetical protein